MRGINHPSIVKLLSFSESPEHYYLVLECTQLYRVDVYRLTLFPSNGWWRNLPPDR
jgi:hypothetical protein